MRVPIHFTISEEFLPLHAFPQDARAFGSKLFIEAARRYYEREFASGSVDVRLNRNGLDISWTPEESALDPLEYAIELLKTSRHSLAVPILTGLLKERPDDVNLLY